MTTAECRELCSCPLLNKGKIINMVRQKVVLEVFRYAQSKFCLNFSYLYFLRELWHLFGQTHDSFRWFFVKTPSFLVKLGSQNFPEYTSLNKTVDFMFNVYSKVGLPLSSRCFSSFIIKCYKSTVLCFKGCQLALQAWSYANLSCQQQSTHIITASVYKASCG